jgi:hypothetical protein
MAGADGDGKTGRCDAAAGSAVNGGKVLRDPIAVVSSSIRGSIELELIAAADPGIWVYALAFSLL